MNGCSITDEYARKGIDTIRLENEQLRVEVLAGKGGDVTEIVAKDADVNVLFEAPHEWRGGEGNYMSAPDRTFSFMDHYPGGWQDVLPAAGGPTTIAGAPYGLHSESPLVPWSTRIVTDTEEAVAVELKAELTRYPFELTRTISLQSDESMIAVSMHAENLGEVQVPYSWLQHVAFGKPLVGPDAQLDVPCETILVDPDHDHPNARFTPGDRHQWPTAELESGTIDLRTFPSKSDRVHDLVALADLSEGWYTIDNPELGLGVTVRFPEDLFEYVWYWQAFGGFEEAPFFGREYVAGLEPCTSIPNAGLERAVEEGTANYLDAGESVTADIELEVRAVR